MPALRIIRFCATFIVLGTAAAAQADIDLDYGRDSLKFAEVSGAKLAYVDTGRGEPVVLVHGAFSDYRSWQPQLEAGSSQFHLYAYSRRDFYPNGHETAPALQTADRDVTDLIQFIEDLGIAPVHLVGHSAGGHAALVAAIRRPDLVKSLVLEEGGFVSDHAVSMQALAETADVIDDYMDFRSAGDPVSAVERFIDFVSGEGWFASARPDVREILLDNEAAFGIRANAPLTCSDTGSINLPVLVVLGERSPPYIDRLLSGLLECLRTERTVTIPGAAHGIHYEQPDAFNRAVFNFIADARKIPE